jgi:hypothetical protein
MRAYILPDAGNWALDNPGRFATNVAYSVSIPSKRDTSFGDGARRSDEDFIRKKSDQKDSGSRLSCEIVPDSPL